MAITARKAGTRDFEVIVDDVGRFVFGYRNMQDELLVQREYSRIVGGVEPGDWLHLLASWISALTVLSVEVPEGWNIAEMDPLVPDDYAKLQKVYEALHAKELSFRGKQLATGT